MLIVLRGFRIEVAVKQEDRGLKVEEERVRERREGVGIKFIKKYENSLT